MIESILGGLVDVVMIVASLAVALGVYLKVSDPRWGLAPNFLMAALTGAALLVLAAAVGFARDNWVFSINCVGSLVGAIVGGVAAAIVFEVSDAYKGVALCCAAIVLGAIDIGTWVLELAIG